MIIVSKVFFGSVAAAAVAGSVVFTDAAEAVRKLAASMQAPSAAAPAPASVAPPAGAAVVVPHGPVTCPAGCGWAQLALHR